MGNDPVRRFLGLERTVPPEALLGLTPDERGDAAIEAALRRQLERVFRHPAGRTNEAEAVRTLLRMAAKQLRETSGGDSSPMEIEPLTVDSTPEGTSRRKRLIRDTRREARSADRVAPLRSPAAAPSPRPESAAPPKPEHAPPRRPEPVAPRTATHHELTDFDRLVLATLVSSGGWNAQSRRRLCALATMHGVGVEGLVRVVRGLGDQARSGAEPMNLASITQGESRMSLPPMRRSATDDAAWVALASRLLPEVRDASVWSTMKLVAAFGLLVLLFAFLLIKASVSEKAAAPEVVTEPAIVAPAAGEVAVVAPGTGPKRPTVVRFEGIPTFLGNAVPAAATEAADACAEIPDHLDNVVRRLELSAAPSDAVFRSWSVSIDTMARGWVLCDETTEALVRRGARAVIFEGGAAPSVADRLMEAFVPPTDRVGAPVDIWRGAWLAGMLGELSESNVLSRGVVERARMQLAIALNLESRQVTMPFIAAADRWLRLTAQYLVGRLEYSDDRFDDWEMWLAAQRHLGLGSRHEMAISAAVTALLRGDADLSRSGPSQMVLGRLIQELDFHRSGVVRSAMAQWFNDGEIDDHDLWVLTSALARFDSASWFDDGLVLPPDGGVLFRNRTRDRILAAWPPVQAGEDSIGRGRVIVVDAETARSWVQLVVQVHDIEPDADDATLLARWVTAAEVNAAAQAMAERRSTALRQSMESATRRLERGSRSARDRVAHPLAIGVSVGRDGRWADAWEQARGDTSTRTSLLNSLRSIRATDLGSVDAEAFVDVVFRASPRGVRDLARDILIEQFRQGPNIALAFLNQFAEHGDRSGGHSELVRRLTGTILPAVQSETWLLAVRRALVQHAASLRVNDAGSIDLAARELAEVFSQRTRLLVGADTSVFALEPTDAVHDLVQAWAVRAESVVAIMPVPDDREGLRRRRATRHQLAEGPIQHLVADLLSVLDYHAYVAVGEQMEIREAVERILDDSFLRRAGASHILRQAIEVEFAMSRIWMLRMGLADELMEDPTDDRAVESASELRQ